jgi:hypothetical protein
MGLLTDDCGDFSLGRTLASGLVALTLLCGGVGGCTAITNNWQTSEGDRVGMVNKISKKGIFWKTYEGQMALEGVASGGNSVGANTWDFSIDNYLATEKQEDYTNQLRRVMDSGQKVKIHYKEMLCTFPWRSGSGVLIESIQPLNVRGIEAKVEKPYLETPVTKGNDSGVTIVDGKTYMLRHDASGKLRVTEMREVQ